MQHSWRSRLLSQPVRRNLLLLFVPWTLLIFLLMALLYEHLLDARLEPLLRDQQISLNEGVGVLNRHLAMLRGNVQFLTQQPLLAEVLRDPSEDNRRALAQLFAEFARSSAVYDQIRWLDEGGAEQVGILAVADAAAGGSDGFHALIGAGGEHGEFAAHGVAVNSEPVGIHLGLLLEEGQGAACRECAWEPCAVAR